jgi:putative peptide zinc metalloprotease protein
LNQKKCVEIRELDNGLFLVNDSRNLKYVKMGVDEVNFLKHLMGSNDINNLNGYTSTDLDSEQQEYLVKKFIEWGFLESELSFEGSKLKGLLKRITDNFSQVELLSVNPERFMRKINPIINFLYSRFLMFVYITIVFTAFVSTILNFMKVVKIFSFKDLTISNMLIFYLLHIVLIFIHEMSHGMTCIHFGGKIKKMGAMLFYLKICFYCDTSEVYSFKEKRHKVLVAFAGILSEVIIYSVLIIIYNVLSYFGIELKILFYVSFFGIIGTFFNIIPLIKLDGYWMLSFALDITNLRDKSFRYLLSPILKNEQLRNNSYSKKEKEIFLIYGILALIFTMFMWISSIYYIYGFTKNYGSTIKMLVFSFIGAIFIMFILSAVKYINKIKNDPFIMNKSYTKNSESEDDEFAVCVQKNIRKDAVESLEILSAYLEKVKNIYLQVLIINKTINKCKNLIYATVLLSILLMITLFILAIR